MILNHSISLVCLAVSFLIWAPTYVQPLGFFNIGDKTCINHETPWHLKGTIQFEIKFLKGTIKFILVFLSLSLVPCWSFGDHFASGSHRGITRRQLVNGELFDRRHWDWLHPTRWWLWRREHKWSWNARTSLGQTTSLICTRRPTWTIKIPIKVATQKHN
jgi:hypothetical protein